MRQETKRHVSLILSRNFLIFVRKYHYYIMPKKTYTTLPEHFSGCLHAGCPMAASCLRQIAYSQMMSEKEHLRIVNPQHCTLNADCKFFRNAKSVQYAKGFTNFQKKMFPDQYRMFMSTLILHFGRTAYFERRNGDTALSPAEQEIVLNALHKAGVEGEFKFDKYIELYNWFD